MTSFSTETEKGRLKKIVPWNASPKVESITIIIKVSIAMKLTKTKFSKTP